MARGSFPARFLLVVFLLTVGLVPTATPKADAPRAEPPISPEQAIALATGRSPQAAADELGDNDFRISDMGDSDGDPAYDADRPAVASHGSSDSAMVVWQGDDEVFPLVDGEVEVFGETFGSPTVITLVSFTARPTSSGILLEWETATEEETLGFNLYRAQALEGEPIRLNEELIPSQEPGRARGAFYEYEDSSAVLCEYYYYWLEDVDASGGATRHGPVSAAMAAYRIYLPMCGE